MGSSRLKKFKAALVEYFCVNQNFLNFRISRITRAPHPENSLILKILIQTFFICIMIDFFESQRPRLSGTGFADNMLLVRTCPAQSGRPSQAIPYSYLEVGRGTLCASGLLDFLWIMP